MAYNPYINSFSLSGDYETYIEGSTAKAPNVAYLKDIDEMRYLKVIPNADYLIHGTTTGTTDFTGSGIQFHVIESLDGTDNMFYAKAEDIPSNLTSLSSCFNTTEGKKITSLKKWTYDTSNVTSFALMFGYCSSLTSIDLSAFNTSNVTNMSAMFRDSTNLTSLDLTSFDTRKVTTMENMFSRCSNLTSLDLRSFDTSSITNSNNITTIFYNCGALNKLYLSSSFFNSTITGYNIFSNLSSWTDTYSIEEFVKAAEQSTGTGRTIDLHNNTLNAMTQGQKDRITGAGWTLQ